ncbi:unnamed protein product, partial [Ixodes hexagonus]
FSLQAELSLQGDDFTRQMWHMYNTFEDVVVKGGPGSDQHQQSLQPQAPQPLPQQSQQQQQPQPQPPVTGDPTAATVAAPAARLEPSATRLVKPIRAPSSPDVRRDSSSSPSASPGARRKKRPMSQRCTYAACQRGGTPSSNPLLDTIGSMTYDPCCESDDYYDLASVYLRRRQGRHSDGESIGYAGSIDSGYKSLCPTPEIPDYDGGTTVTGQPDAKPKIMMGTRLMSKQGKPTQEELDADLDHLMQLRQSLLTAIARCESPASPKSPRTTTTTASDKTVRFSTDKSTAAVSKSRTTSAAGNGGRTKPILKDPLCANLRANMERPDSGGTLEEEIDGLLCGKPDYYDLDAKFPPSTYVTMVEEKYRCSTGYSVAKVKCLKDKCQESCKDHNHATLLKAENARRQQQQQQLLHHTTQQQQQHQPHQPHPQQPQQPQQPTQRRTPSPAHQVLITGDPANVTACSRGATKSGPESPRPTLIRSAKSRFNEVAKCMLEIIEDLQHKKLTDPRSSRVRQPPAPPTPQLLRDAHAGGKRCSGVPQQRPVSDSEYHVYEEVLYDFVSTGSTASDATVKPPPLPARPVEPGNRPKQRSNLYSLVRNQEERRNISRSLEQERSSDKRELGDEYGFRSLTNS